MHPHSVDKSLSSQREKLQELNLNDELNVLPFLQTSQKFYYPLDSMQSGSEIGKQDIESK